VSSEDEWPDDLFPLLQMARDGMLEQESPSPTPEVLAYLEEPAHGKVDGEGSLLRPLEVEPMELALLTPQRRRAPRRALVAIGGSAAAIALVVLGLRPTFAGPQTTIMSARTSAPTVAPSVTSEPAPSGESTPVTDASPDDSVAAVPDVVVPPDVTATAPAAPDTTAAPASPAPPTSAKAPAPTTAKSRAKAPSGTRTPATTAPPAVAPTASQVVLAYYEASNTRGRCVAHQPSRSTQAQLVAACGPSPTPPANLLQYWAARDSWNACADQFFEKGWARARVESACGAEPQRADFGVPPNPYSKSQN